LFGGVVLVIQVNVEGGHAVVQRTERMAIITGFVLVIGCLANGCFKNRAPDPVVPDSPFGEPLVIPSPQVPDRPADGAAAKAHDAGVPPFDFAAHPRPALPGLPRSAATSTQPLSLAQADGAERYASTTSDDDTPGDRKGPIKRLFERIRERNKPIELPPALEDPKSNTPEKPKDDKTTTLPPAVVPDRPGSKPAEVQPVEAREPQANADLQTVRAIVDAAEKKFNDTPDFKCVLSKFETINGKKLPTEDATFYFRQEPFSVRLTVTSDAGLGREVLYVKGQNKDKLTIVTGKGDNRLVGSGFKITLDPSDPRATARTRGKIDESGLGRPIRILKDFVVQAEKGQRPAGTIKYLEKVQRKEFKEPMLGVEVTLLPQDDDLLPKGGKRLYCFDANAKSPSLHLPVLIISYDPSGEELEYFCFKDFTLPGKLSDDVFDPSQLGKKR
jgi:hypothetical protein